MTNRVRRFTANMQTIAWEELQLCIADALAKTPGEYDAPSLIDSAANFMRRQYGVDYTQTANYLEGRYSAEDAS